MVGDGGLECSFRASSPPPPPCAPPSPPPRAPPSPPSPRPSSHSAARSHTPRRRGVAERDEEGLVDEPAVVDAGHGEVGARETRGDRGAGEGTDDGGGFRVVTEALAADEQAPLADVARVGVGVLVGGGGEADARLHRPGTNHAKRANVARPRSKFGVVDRRARTRETEGVRVRAPASTSRDRTPVEPTAASFATSFSSDERWRLIPTTPAPVMTATRRLRDTRARREAPKRDTITGRARGKTGPTR